ncbi:MULTISPECIES: HlyD family type I secretion periplasmic adaptor subunit [unclassified Bradyrhizobium]|uniref:HlyD family type I secretion periplasmic adaptor subunit n=1 Tax=unclassified Bradyrhizobium TaxID=2631580 RepID=UPI0028E4B7C8|nr:MULTISPECIES: HlyD family type I secretion periplasmic adaptor subunit [unclassified Bradyrhizobium]
MPPESAATATVIPLRVAARRRDELEFLPAALEIVETPASPIGRAIAATIIAFFCLAIVWATFGHVDIIATASGRVIPSGHTKVIQPFETGVVRAIHVAEGQQVAAGEVLVELDPAATEADVRKLQKDLQQDHLDIARLETLFGRDLASFAPPPGADMALVDSARSQMEAQAAEQDAKLAGLDRQIAQKQAEADEARAVVARIEAVLPILQDQRDIREKAMHIEFGSKLLFLQVEQQYVEQQHQLLAERHKLNEVTQAIAALQKQRVQAEAEYRKSLLADLAKAKVQANEHGEEAVKAARRRELQTLRAPLDGSVQQLAVHTIGGVVTPAQQLMVIVPREAKLEIEANLANKDVGFVHPGQDVEVKIETFNFTRYGLLHGTVMTISRDVVAPDLTAPDRRDRQDDPALARSEEDRQARQPTYVAHIALARTSIETEDGFTSLEPGMAVTAEIKTGRRRVIEYLLSPLLRYRHEAWRER